MPDNLKQKTIVIAGGGFAGVNCAIALAKKLGDAAKIILVSKTQYHYFHPNLYEVAASEEEFAGMQALKKSVAIPLRDILPESVQFVHAEITSIDPDAQLVNDIQYDYLVCAFGSTTDFFGITGLEQYAYQLKSVTDALRIRNQMEFTVESHQMDMKKRLLRFIVGGGGFTGVELSGELINLLDILSWKYNYPRERLELAIIEGTNGLLPGLSTRVSAEIKQRLEDSGVQIHLGNFVSQVTAAQVILSNKEILNYDMLIWTGGVRAVPIPFLKAMQLDAKGRLSTCSHLNISGYDNIFAIGDCACILDKFKRPVPPNAQQAIYQAHYVSSAITRLIQDRRLQAFKAQESSYIIAVRGKWAALHLPFGVTMFGFIPWLAKRVADLDYFMKLMPFWQAVKLAWFDTELYSRND